MGSDADGDVDVRSFKSVSSQASPKLVWKRKETAMTTTATVARGLGRGWIGWTRAQTAAMSLSAADKAKE